MEIEISLKDIFKIIYKRLWIIFLFALIGLVAAFGISKFFIKPKYVSTTSLYVQSSQSETSRVQKQTLSDLQYAERLINTYIVILKNEDFLLKVAENTNLGYSATDIVKLITLSSISDTEVFQIKVESTDPYHAKIIAAEIANLAPEEITRVVNAGNVQTIQTAKLAHSASSPNVRNNALIGMMAGLILALILAFVLELSDTTVKSAEDLNNQYDIPVLGSIPTFETNGGAK